MEGRTTIHVFPMVWSLLVVVRLPFESIEQELINLPGFHPLRNVEVLIIESMRSFHVSLHVFEAGRDTAYVHGVLFCKCPVPQFLFLLASHTELASIVDLYGDTVLYTHGPHPAGNHLDEELPEGAVELMAPGKESDSRLHVNRRPLVTRKPTVPDEVVRIGR